MFPNKTVGWANSSGGYTTHYNNSKFAWPFWFSALVYVGVAVSIVTIILATADYKASQSVVYEPQTVKTIPIQSGSAAPLKPSNKTETPGVTVPANYNTKLQKVLDDWEKSHKSHQWGVVVQGLGSDKRVASINPSESFATASVFKLLMVYPLFQTYTLESLDKTYVSVEGRGEQSMKDCLELMLKVSDNACGIAVAWKVDWVFAEKELQKLGLASTSFSSSAGLVTSASDMTKYLELLNSGKLLDGPTRKYVIGLMRQQQVRNGIPAGCPGCTVADKIGSLDYARNDVAIIKYHGGAYILSILTNGASFGEIAELTSQIQHQMVAQPKG